MPDPVVAIPTAAPATPPVIAQPTPAPAKSTPAAPGAVTPPVVSTPASVVKPPDGMVPISALHEERTKRQELAQEVEALKRMVQNPSQPQAPQMPGTIAPRDRVAELDKLWETDPKQAVRVEIMYAMDWRDEQDASLNQQADTLAMKYPDFNNYRSATLAQIRKLPAHQRSVPGIIEAAYYMSRGQNVDLLLRTQQDELQAKFLRGEITAQQLQQPAGTFTAPITTPGSVQLSNEQLAVCQQMGINPEDYAANIKLNSPGGR